MDDRAPREVCCFTNGKADEIFDFAATEVAPAVTGGPG
jgi:hypothetical protein